MATCQKLQPPDDYFHLPHGKPLKSLKQILTSGQSYLKRQNTNWNWRFHYNLLMLLFEIIYLM